jgi:hypothetical protein
VGSPIVIHTIILEFLDTLGIEVSECTPFGFSNVMVGNLALSPRFIDSSHFFHGDSAVAECVLAVDDECIVCQLTLL